jgi:hypothetical protein
VRVRFSPEALQAVRGKRAWWKAPRDKAPHLLVEELAAVVAKLRNGTDKDRREYALQGGRIIWRVLMRKTKLHVYYRVDYAAGVTEIMTVWNAVSSAAPDF